MIGAKLIVRIIAPSVRVRMNKQDQTNINLETNVLTLGTDNERGYKWFLAHVRESHGYRRVNKYSIKLWQILHELGHYFTDSYTDEGEESNFIRIMCALSPENLVEDKKAAFVYFDLSKEWAATQWAINWIEYHGFKARLFSILARFQDFIKPALRTHKKTFKNFQKILSQKFQNFFLKKSTQNM